MQCIMDEPVMQWASLALPAPQAMARNSLPADLGSELGCRLRPTSCHLEEKGNVIKCGFTLISSLCQPFNKNFRSFLFLRGREPGSPGGNLNLRAGVKALHISLLALPTRCLAPQEKMEGQWVGT